MRISKNITIGSEEELAHHAGDLAQEQLCALSPTDHGKIAYALLFTLNTLQLAAVTHGLQEKGKAALEALHGILNFAGIEQNTTIIQHNKKDA